MKLTTVITTYNRRHSIEYAIDSTLLELQEHEIVIVDDASTDNTAQFVKSKYSSEIQTGQIKLICLINNIGVSGAKNRGYEESTGEWVIFLDSDDQYEKQSGQLISDELRNSSNYPIVFLRCRNHLGSFVGTRKGERLLLDLKTYLKFTSFGEALTAINKTIVKSKIPYIQQLRGYEGLGCARLIRDHGPAILSPVTGRVYFENGEDRLSSKHGYIQRIQFVAKGHTIMVKEFSQQLDIPTIISLIGKAIIYYIIGYIYTLTTFKK
ncbi:glycosyltransferase family 2 protein [Limnobacter sp.]|uniref:glycosyltransferase family 2 protein n=1 Tax=Limnobacter sp. TaxID=2003368 RepID=UPI002FE37A90